MSKFSLILPKNNSNNSKEEIPNIYAVQQDAQNVLMSEFIQHIC